MCPIKLNDSIPEIAKVNFNGTEMSNVYYVKPDGTQILLFTSSLKAPSITFVSKTYNSISIKVQPNNYLPHTLKLDVRDSNNISVYNEQRLMISNVQQAFIITGLKSNQTYTVISWVWTLLKGDGPSISTTYTTNLQLTADPIISDSTTTYYNKINFVILKNSTLSGKMKVLLYDTSNTLKFNTTYDVGAMTSGVSGTISKSNSINNVDIGNPDSTVTYYLKAQYQDDDGKDWSNLVSKTIITPKQTVTSSPNIGTITPGIAIIQVNITNNDAKPSRLDCRILKSDGVTIVSTKVNNNGGPGFLQSEGTSFIFTSTDGLDKNTKYYIQAAAYAIDGEYKVSPWFGGTSYSTTTLDFPTTTNPTIGTIVVGYTTASVPVKNEYGSTATIYCYVDNTNSLQSQSVSGGGSYTFNFSDYTKNTDHTAYAYAIGTSAYQSGTVSKAFTTANWPTLSFNSSNISIVTNNYTYVKWSVYNPNSASATIYTNLENKPLQTSPVSGNASISIFEASGLTKNTSYKIYAHLAADYYYDSSEQYITVKTPDWQTIGQDKVSITIGTPTSSSINWTLKNDFGATATLFTKLSTETSWSSSSVSANQPFYSSRTGLSASTKYTIYYYIGGVANYYNSEQETATSTTLAMPKSTSPSITATAIKSTYVSYTLKNNDTSRATVKTWIVLRSTGATVANSTKSYVLDGGTTTASSVTSPTLSKSTTYVVKAETSGVAGENTSDPTLWTVTTTA